MPNWCDTTYRAVGTKEQVKKFYDLAMSSWKKSQDDNQGWLGHLVTELGGDWQKVSCRGWMQDEPMLAVSGEECTIVANTAWGEPHEWRKFIEEKIYGLTLFYLAIEPGCCLYLSNMDDYVDKYYVDNLNDGSEILDEDATIDYVNEHFGKKFETIDECIDFAGEYEEDGDSVLWINQIENGE